MSASTEYPFRAKWLCDGAESIEEMAYMLEKTAKWLREMAAAGVVLRDTVQDDYGFLEALSAQVAKRFWTTKTVHVKP